LSGVQEQVLHSKQLTVLSHAFAPQPAAQLAVRELTLCPAQLKSVMLLLLLLLLQVAETAKQRADAAFERFAGGLAR
jgi:hypothetical protein